MKNILIYSQMRFQLYRTHIMTVIGLKSGKKSINRGGGGGLWAFKRPSGDLKFKTRNRPPC